MKTNFMQSVETSDKTQRVWQKIFQHILGQAWSLIIIGIQVQMYFGGLLVSLKYVKVIIPESDHSWLLFYKVKRDNRLIVIH